MLRWGGVLRRSATVSRGEALCGWCMEGLCDLESGGGGDGYGVVRQKREGALSNATRRLERNGK